MTKMNRAHQPQPQPNPFEIIVIEGGRGMIFKVSNKGLKMLKAGMAFEKSYANGQSRLEMIFVSHDAYVAKLKPKIEERQKAWAEEQKEKVEAYKKEQENKQETVESGESVSEKKDSVE